MLSPVVLLTLLDLFFSHHSAGYPLISYFTKHSLSTLGGFNIGGINGTGQVGIFCINLLHGRGPTSSYRFRVWLATGV
jgi:hypothetical protein